MPKAPTPVSELKARRADLPPLAEYAIRLWLNSARTELTTATKKWEDGKTGVGSPLRVEEAYLANKKAAEILARLPSHPDYAKLMAGKASTEYYTYVDLRGTVIQAAQTNKEIMALLEKREAEWHDRPPSPSSSRSAPPNGSTHPASPPPSSGHAGGYFSPPTPPHTSSSPPPDPPAAPNSIAQRLAALRSAGLESTPSRPLSRPPPSPPALPSSSYHPPPSSSHPRQPASPTLTPLALPPQSPKIPRKPSNLSRSPPGSPRALDADAVADERSGSAPPVIVRPRSPTSNGTSTAREDWGGRERSPTTPPSTAGLGMRSPLTPPGTMALGLGVAKEFGSHFPSVEQWESGFPQVPTLLPGIAKPEARRPLPAPPKPVEKDAREFEKENADRALAMGKLAGYGSGIPAALVPGRVRGSSVSKAAGGGFTIPFTNEVLPKALYAYLAQTLSAPGRGPRVLLLDVRSRNEFDHARIVGDAVCLEPVGLRLGVTSVDLEGQLNLAPPSELALFASRDQFDVVVIYDRASTSIPNASPPSTSSDAQRALWNLTNAIYDLEFQKSLKRQPVLLKGGWEAWGREVGSKGIVREGQEPSREDLERAEAKKANRRTAVMQVGLGGPAVVRNGAESVPLGYPTSSNNQSSGYFSPPPINYTSSYSSPMGDTLMSPRLAMPPTAVQRSGSNASFDPYPPSVSTSRPSYPQPHLNGFANPSSTNGSSSSMPTLPRTRSEFGDLQAQSSQSYTSYNAPRTSIDYPQLRSPALPTSSRPAYPSTAPLPHTLTRPPAIQPAPIRSNSSFALPNSYPTSSQSKFISNYTFGDDAIGLTGLKNLGNTCYMNSTIQCLSATIPFAKYFKEGGFKRDVNRVNPLGTKGALADAVSELIRAMWAQNYLFLSPVTFRDQICRFASQFRGSDQHDAQEFLGFLLDGLHEDLNYIVQKPPPVEMTPEREHDLETLPAQVMSSREWDIYRRRDDSFVVQCFQGQFRNQMKCLTCSKTSTTYNTFMPLSIPVPSGRGISKVTLQDCISAFVREEILDKDDAWFCPRCKKARKTSKKLSLSRLPPILVIHLKRFSFHGPFSDKIETQVQYPLSGLDLTSYVPPPLFDPRAPPPSGPPKGHVYDLYGVTNHYGNLSSGHYTAYVRNHNEWNHIGDSKVSAATPQMVESNRNSYILWYRKV